MINSCNAHAHTIQSILSLRLQTCYTIRVASNDNFSLSLTTSGCGGGDLSYSRGFKIVVDGFHDGKLIVSSQSCIKITKTTFTTLSYSCPRCIDIIFLRITQVAVCHVAQPNE